MNFNEGFVYGKRCVFYNNDYHRTVASYAGSCCQFKDISAKKFEIFRLGINKKDWEDYPDDTPLFKREGWDNLDEAKAFFLLQEI